MSEKTGPQEHTKPDGSAWAAHAERLAARNSETQRVGRAERKRSDLEAAAAQRASELRQMVALKKAGGPRGKAHRD
jgi:hypothetical protein